MGEREREFEEDLVSENERCVGHEWSREREARTVSEYSSEREESVVLT